MHELSQNLNHPLADTVSLEMALICQTPQGDAQETLHKPRIPRMVERLEAEQSSCRACIPPSGGTLIRSHRLAAVNVLSIWG
ncbi:hypothetical protein ACRALDRAFT_1078046 [Sodiomyces alcalophilus JCM 7366]|uniref:uncharacterized protein n=1 Tax=Sodiomyces alcalophilus JCM 7366 TaxID=591952 RepID=UPI0039B6015A